MALTWASKDPNELLDYSWQVPLDAGDTIVSHTAVAISGSVTVPASRIVGSLITLDLAGGTIGETALFTLTATTAAGRVYEETAALPIVSSAYVATTADVLNGYLLEARVARHKLATGAGVVQVSRDGRTVTYTRTSMADLDLYIAQLQEEILTASAGVTGAPRRSAISPVWFN